MRPVLRLLPLTLCIAISLQAHAADGKSAPSYKLCPRVDAVPAFDDAQKAPEGLNVLNSNHQPTDIEGDLLSGTEANPVFNGNVTMRRGDQFMGADQLTFDKAQNRYNAEGSVRYQASGLRMRAARAEGDQASDTHTMQNLEYQLLSRRGNGKAQSLNMTGDVGSLYGATYSTCPPEERNWELRAWRV